MNTKVKGTSMLPTIPDGTLLLCSNFNRNFKKGDIIIAKNPLKDSIIVKRIKVYFFILLFKSLFLGSWRRES